MDGMSITIPKSATMLFYINDYNSVDNGASVTLEFSQAAPLPGSLVLFGSGLLAFISWRRRVKIFRLKFPGRPKGRP